MRRPLSTAQMQFRPSKLAGKQREPSPHLADTLSLNWAGPRYQAGAGMFPTCTAVYCGGTCHDR